MRVVKIHKNNKKKLKEYSDGTFDEIINNLIDDVEDKLPVYDIDFSTITSMKIKDDTTDRLNSYKLSEGESYENVLVRMLILAQALNNR